MMSSDNRLLPTLQPPAAERSFSRPLSDLAAQSKAGYGIAQNEPTHLRDYLNVVLKRKWLILSLVFVVTSLVTIQMYRLPPVYEAATTIMIEPKKESILRSGREQVIINAGRGNDPLYINTQLRLLENPALSRQVIKTLDLPNNPEFLGAAAQTGFISSLRKIFARDKKPVLSTPGDTLGASTEVIPETEVTDQQLSAQEMEKLEPYEMTIAANLSVEPVTGTNLVTLRYRHTNPELTHKIVNTLADTFIYNNLDRETLGSIKAQRTLTEKIAELQFTVKQQEEQRVNMARLYNIPDGLRGADLPAERSAMLSRQLLEAEDTRKKLQALYETASGVSDPNSIPEIQEDKRIQDLRKKLEELELKRAEMMEIYTEEWPEVKKLDAQIIPLKEALKKAPREVVTAMKARFESARAREKSLELAFNKQQGETTGQNMAQIKLNSLKQDLETNKQYLAMLRQRLNEIENTASERANNVTVTTYSRVPREPVGPARLRTIVLAFLLSLGAGVGLAFLLDYLDDTLKTVDDVDRYLHLPSLALIPANRNERPRLKGRRALPAPAVAPDGSEVTALALITDARSPVAEAYRHLRTSLLLSSAGQPPKTILVTSSQPSEGKTTTAVNTAVMLAQTGAEVLIMDCDLRRPRVHTNFNTSNARGLTNYLAGEKDLDTLLHTYDKLPNLKLLTSGPVPPNPAELLGSTEMRQLLNVLSERFTHVVIDSPPAISFTDASILSTLVDGVMLVVHGGRSSRAVVRRAKQQLVDVGANIFGAVLNNVKLDSPDYYYYAGYYSQEYESDDDENATSPAEGVAGTGSAR